MSHTKNQPLKISLSSTMADLVSELSFWVGVSRPRQNHTVVITEVIIRVTLSHLFQWVSQTAVITKVIIRVTLSHLFQSVSQTAVIIKAIIRVTLSHLFLIVQELCESRGGHPGLSVLTSLLVSVDVKIYWTVLQCWSQLVPNMSAESEDIKHQFIIIIFSSQCLRQPSSLKWL